MHIIRNGYSKHERLVNWYFSISYSCFVEVLGRVLSLYLKPFYLMQNSIRKYDTEYFFLASSSQTGDLRVSKRKLCSHDRGVWIWAWHLPLHHSWPLWSGGHLVWWARKQRPWAHYWTVLIPIWELLLISQLLRKLVCTLSPLLFIITCNYHDDIECCCY